MAIVGIDLGTTNSLIGIIEKGRPRLFRGPDGQTLVPSVIYFPKKGSPLVGTPAFSFKGTDPTRTVYSAKRFIGRGLGDVQEWTHQLPFDFSASSESMVRFQMDEKSYTPIEISAFVLKELKRIAEQELGQSVTKAVVTVPAYFNDAQRQATKFAGELAGLEVVRIVNEPTAACLAYGLNKKTSGTIAVFDLGGGTFDISILRVQDGIFEVLATNGDTALGGDDFDHAIAVGLKALIPGLAHAAKSGTAQAQLTREAERLKRILSERETAGFQLQLEGEIFSTEISRADLEKWIAPILARTEGPCLRCLEDAHLDTSKISDVILVGGSTRVPLVQKKVEELFRRLPICSLDPDEVVAMGATVQANILEGQMSGMLLLDVIPLSLGIETMGGVVSRIVHRNSTIPISASERFSTYVDGQTAVDIHVLQGEREMVEGNRSLARFQLKGLPPLPAGVPKIEVEFIIDANGILSVRATELRTGKVASVTVNPSYGLSSDEIEKMLGDAYANAESDFEKRFLEESKTEADSLIRATRKSLGAGRSLVPEEEVTAIEKALQELETSLTSPHYKPIRAKIEELGKVTQHLAEELLNHAVSEALRGQSLQNEKTEKPS